jgi:hypothetical protein
VLLFTNNITLTRPGCPFSIPRAPSTTLSRGGELAGAPSMVRVGVSIYTPAVTMRARCGDQPGWVAANVMMTQSLAQSFGSRRTLSTWRSSAGMGRYELLTTRTRGSWLRSRATLARCGACAGAPTGSIFWYVPVYDSDADPFRGAGAPLSSKY